MDLLSITVAETGTAELTPNPNAFWVTTVGLGVNCLLAALVASGSLEIHSKPAESDVSDACLFMDSKRETHCGAVVHFFSNVVADVLQLCFCDVVHRSHYMGNSPGTIEGAAAGLKKNQNTAADVHTHLTETINGASAF